MQGGQLSITEGGSNDRLVLRLVGEIDLMSADELTQRARQLRPGQAVEVDLAGVSFIDSTGVRSLISLNEASVQASGQPLNVARPSDAVAKLIRLTGLDQLLTVTE